METLHFWFVCFSIAVMFFGSIMYIMYFFGVNPVYDYFKTNTTNLREFVAALFFMYYVASGMVIIADLIIGVSPNKDGSTFWGFVLIFEFIPPVIIILAIIWISIKRSIEGLNRLHNNIVAKRKG